MSKPVKNLIVKEYERRFQDVTSAVLIDVRGIDANQNNALRTDLAGNGIRITVVKNSLAKKVFDGSAMAPINELLEGPCAMVYGGESVVNVARALIDKAKEIQGIEFKGAIMDGQVFGPDDITRLSKFPTRDEALAEAVQVILSAGSNLMGAVTGPGAQVMSLVKSVEEKLEKGEAIAKVG